MRSLYLGLGLVLMLAGCFSAEEPTVTPAGVAEDDADAAMMEATAADAPNAPNASRAFPFAFEGTTSTSLCAPSGPNSCAGPGLGSDENTMVDLVYEGVAERVTATLTWSAATPATTRMYLTLMSGEEWIQISGMSPLELDTTGFAGEMTLYVGIERPMPSPEPVHYGFSVEQAFTLEGSVIASNAS